MIRMKVFCTAFSAVVALGLACAPHSPPNAQKSKASTDNALVSDVKATPVALAQDGNWGTITGRIVWGGEVPKATVLDLKNNPDAAACQKKGPLPDQTWVVNAKNKGLQFTFVWLESATKGEKLPIHPKLQKVSEKNVEIDQPICIFHPHAVGLREGQNLVAKNGASIAHNFKWQGDPAVNPGGNVLLPPGGEKSIEGLMASRLPVSIECNIHPWMKGWVRVFDHPYFAVTDEEGNFTIKDAPVGDHRLKIWHGSGGWAGGAKGKNGQPISVKAGENKTGNLEYPAP